MRKCPFRYAAVEAGLAVYSTGKPCRRGHISTRSTRDGSCTECRREWARNNRPYFAEYQRKRRVPTPRKPSKTREDKRRDQQDYRDRLRAVDPEGFRNRTNTASRRYAVRHPGRILARTRRREVAVRERTPPWADLAEIRRIYEECPTGYQVDHVIPLRGKVRLRLAYPPKSAIPCGEGQSPKKQSV